MKCKEALLEALTEHQGTVASLSPEVGYSYSAVRKALNELQLAGLVEFKLDTKTMAV